MGVWNGTPSQIYAGVVRESEKLASSRLHDYPLRGRAYSPSLSLLTFPCSFGECPAYLYSKYRVLWHLDREALATNALFTTYLPVVFTFQYPSI